jgi:hypothetical protein
MIDQSKTVISFYWPDWKGIAKSISTGAQCVTRDSKIYCEEVKCASLAQEIGFSPPNSCSLPWVVKGATHLCTSKTECDKLDRTAAQYI